MGEFPFSKMLVHNRAQECLPLAHRLARSVPREWSTIADQLRRAILSIPLNIAEGCTENSVVERARFYRIARRSAAECESLVQAMEILGLGDSATRASLSAKLSEVAAMLTSLILKVPAFKPKAP